MVSSLKRAVEKEVDHTSKRPKTGPSKVKDDDPPLTLVIKDRMITPTPRFDTFWRFAATRQSIDDKRREGLPAPWTDDSVLSTTRFCNVFRVLDRASQYLIREVIERGPQEPTEVIFRVVLFNTFTNIKTYELLRKGIQPLTWATYTRDKYEGLLRPLYESQISIYTGSYRKPAANMGYSENFMNHLVLLEDLMEELPQQVANAKFLVDVYDWLLPKPGMGEFTAYQLLLNLSYSSIMNFSEFDFVAVGLGARAGLRQCFGDVPRSMEVTIIRWMQATQSAHFARLGLSFEGLGPDHAPLMLCDIEHTLCELDKYVRVDTGKSRGRAYDPSNARPLEKLCLPKAWSNSARRTPRLKPVSKTGADEEVVEKYDVASIRNHRVVKGKLQLHVYWRGYPDDESTWEPESVLLEDAPEAVKDYWETTRWVWNIRRHACINNTETLQEAVLLSILVLLSNRFAAELVKAVSGNYAFERPSICT